MKKAYLKNFIVLTIFAASVFGCGKEEVLTNFADICRSENHSTVYVKGYLRNPIPPDAVSDNRAENEYLLVENENGTGGFIQIKMNNAENFSIDSQVKISGEVIKDANSCVLKIIKIEMPKASEKP